MKPLLKSFALAAVVAATVSMAPQAEAARVVVGVGVGVPIGSYGYYGPGYYGPAYWGPYYGPRYYYPPATVVQAAPRHALPTAPDPIFYPKNSQSTAQVETDRRDCNRWATTQPGAMTDAGIFQRATYACMEGRGYTVR